SNCNTPVGYGQNHCYNCGRYISQNSSFCAYCGSNLKSGDTNREYTDNSQGFNQTNQSYSDQSYAYSNNQQYDQRPYRRKSRMLAGIFAILLGNLGIHNFYIGKNNLAITQLLLSTIGAFVTCGISAICVYIWALIEGIMIFTGNIDRDASGVPFED
ncbi:MAG: NINE protein, partial [Oscillospiraceae bacterium]